MNRLMQSAVFCSVLSLPTLCAAYNFFDPGYVNGPGIVATDYFDPNYGRPGDPLQTTSCIFNDGGARCGLTHNYTFSKSNYWSQGWPAICPNGIRPNGKWCAHNWTLILNNDTVLGDSELDPLNPGPPDVSIARADVNEGLMGFTASKLTDNVWRANIAIDFDYMPTQGFPGSGPFVAFGAWNEAAGFGNGGPIGALNPSAGNPSVLHFGTHVWEATLPSKDTRINGAAITSQVYIMANWGGVPKYVAVFLYHNINGDLSLQSGWSTANGPNHAGASDWSWPFPKSGWYPGAKIAEITAEAIPAACNDNTIITTTSTSPTMILSLNQYIGHEVNYTIDVQKLFKCASDHGEFSNAPFAEPLPATADLPIFGVMWAVEGYGSNGGGIWVDVHSMTMTTH